MKKQSLLFALSLCSLMAVSCKKNVSVDVSTDGTTVDSITTPDKNITTIKEMSKAYVKNDIPNITRYVGSSEMLESTILPNIC